MPSNFTNLAVDWYDATDSYVTTADITNDVKSIPIFTDTGTGEVNEAKIILRALDGNYIVSGNIIDVYDRFRIRVTDSASNSYDRYFEVVNIIPSVSKGQGSLLALELLGIEYHTQHINMAQPYWFEDGYTVVKEIGDFYNRLKGSLQPRLSNHNVVWISDSSTEGNGAPFYNANNFEYGLNEEVCYNRWMDVLDKLGSSVDAGGALTFYELSFKSTGINAIDMRFRPSGDNTTGLVTLKNAKVTNPLTVSEQEGVISNPTGTHVVAWGSNDHGTLPYEYSKYFSYVEAFYFRPDWVTGTYYAVDAKVQVVDSTTQIIKHYKCAVAHTSGTFATDLGAGKWTQIDQKGEFGDSVQYSPWTDGKARLWTNSGADPQRNTYTYGAWFDINVVIKDREGFFRTWVDAKAVSNAELDTLAGANGYSYVEGDRNYFPNGFRVLVNGTGSGDLANFDNMVVEYRRIGPTSYSWVKLYSFGTNAIDATTKVSIVVLHEGKIYEGRDFDTTPTWNDVSTADYGNDCIHPYTAEAVAADGFDILEGTVRSEITDNTNFPDVTDDGTAFTQNVNSAVSFTSTVADIISTTFSFASGDNDWYKNTIGFSWRVPFPCNTSGGISEKVGELYGGGGHSNWATSTAYTRGDKVLQSGALYMCIEDHTSGTFSTDKNTNYYWEDYYPEPSTLDIQNMSYARDGQRGFNTDDSCLDLGQINAVALWAYFTITDAATGNELNDEHRFRAWFCDTKDNIVYQDFSISHSANWQDIYLPISSFRNYRGRKPLHGVAVATAAFVPPKELEVLNIFEWRNVKLFGIQYQAQYDDQGRFNPVNATVNEDGNSVTWSNLVGSTRALTIDGFRFIKPLLAHSGEEKTRNIEPDFLQRPNITNYLQLESDAKSQLEVEKFQHKSYVIENSGDAMFDINFGDSFYLENDKVISDSDNGSNTIKLVAKRIEYSITKPVSGRGGLKRKINGAKVFT